MIKQDNEITKLFDSSRHTERELRIYGKKFVTDINLDLPDYYVSIYKTMSSTHFRVKIFKVSIDPQNISSSPKLRANMQIIRLIFKRP
jgi:hypothetical protein